MVAVEYNAHFMYHIPPYLCSTFSLPGIASGPRTSIGTSLWGTGEHTGHLLENGAESGEYAGHLLEIGAESGEISVEM